MTLRLKLLLRVVKRRVDAGEKLDAVLRDYPRLSEAEKKLMQGLLTGSRQDLCAKLFAGSG